MKTINVKNRVKDHIWERARSRVRNSVGYDNWNYVYCFGMNHIELRVYRQVNNRIWNSLNYETY